MGQLIGFSAAFISGECNLKEMGLKAEGNDEGTEI
jgi:hypothetical protein